MPQLIVISILLLTITFLFFKLKHMAQELTDLQTAATAAVQKIADLTASNTAKDATIADLQSQLANVIAPADLVPITTELNNAVNPPAA